MRTLSTSGIEVATAIGNRQPFKTRGALRAERVNGLTIWDRGRLSGADRECFDHDSPQIRYVVFSYATPIAWVRDDGKVHKVAQRFSQTTSKHQRNLYLLNDERAS